MPVGDNYETRKRVLVETSEKEIVTEGLLPAVERSSGEETVTDGLLPAVERSFEEETATVDGNDGQDLRTLDDSERCYGRWLLNGPRERRP